MTNQGLEERKMGRRQTRDGETEEMMTKERQKQRTWKNTKGPPTQETTAININAKQ